MFQRVKLNSLSCSLRSIYFLTNCSRHDIVEEELTKGVIRIRKSTKGKTIERQDNSPKGKDDDLQNTTQKTKDRAKRIPT
jgi:hypothetical protein